jgi:hypothetical protein
MQELRLVAVSEDGSYAILAVPGRSGRFLLPIDDRLRTVAKGQFSRLAQYEIEVENPLRPKEIQDRIRAGETADEIADAAGIPPDKIRRFEGPILAERQYQAEQAQRATIRGHGDSGPGPRLGDVVGERLSRAGVSSDGTEWDSRKRPDGNWQIHLQFSLGGTTGTAEWIYDPRRRHVIPDDDQAVKLSIAQAEWTGIQLADRGRPRATVTPISSRQAAQQDADRLAALAREAVAAAASQDLSVPAEQPRPAADAGRDLAADQPDPAESVRKSARRAASGRARRSSVPSWDEIMFGTSRQPD